MKLHHDRRIGTTGILTFLVSISICVIFFIGCKKEVSAPVIEYGSVTDIDSNSYKTIKTWMTENLKVSRLNNGNPIALIDTIISDSDWQGSTAAAYSSYNFNVPDTILAVYGALYNWYAVKTNNLCPSGWHIPSDTEWNTLKTFVGGESIYLGIKNIASGKLKETDTIHWNYPNSLSTNETGFTALPGGWLKWNGLFTDIGKMGLWWSSSESDLSRAWYFEILRRAPEKNLFHFSFFYKFTYI
jgi:uncharacterized protein (TIGR02145 family)